MHVFRQIWAVTIMNVESLPLRIGASLVTVIGVACAVAVLISLLAVGAGIMKSVDKNDRPDLAIVLSSGAAAEYMGSFSRADVAMIGAAPGVKKTPDGKLLVQPQATVIVEVIKKSDGGAANVLFRGTGLLDRRMRPEIQITAGRQYRAGLHEIVVGRAASRNFRDLDLGNTVLLRGTPWKVVGIYEDKGGIDENAIASDADTVLAAFGRTGYQSVSVQLVSPDAFNTFRDALKRNPQLSVDVKLLAQYYRDQIKPLSALYDFVGYFVGTIMAIGAVFGAITTMYAAVDSRARDIATLRAIGFGSTAVVVSVFAEALLLAIPGAILGVLVAALIFNERDVAIGNISFQLAVTPGLVVLAIVWAVLIGFLGGLAPSIRAARLPVATALRAT